MTSSREQGWRASWSILALLLGTAALQGRASAQRIYGVEPGGRSRAHQSVARCEQCHETQKSTPAKKCLGCHAPVGERIERGAGLHARFAAQKIECARCHREHRGTNYDISGWVAVGGSSFDHAVTGFALRGKHLSAQAGCKSCHPGSPQHFDPPSSLCSDKSCHGSDDVHRGSLGSQCAQCHTETSAWNRHIFEHNDPAVPQRFRLAGKHLKIGCESCHRRPAPSMAPTFKPTAKECRSCHHDPHKGRHGKECSKCHEPSGWK